MSSPVSAPYCRAVLWGEADPEQFLPPLQRVLEVSVAWLVMPSKNPVEQLQRSAGHAAVVDACRTPAGGVAATGQEAQARCEAILVQNLVLSPPWRLMDTGHEIVASTHNEVFDFGRFGS